MQNEQIERIAADRIWKVFDNGECCQPVRELIGCNDLELAYRVQEINNKRRIERGERMVGVKVGLTSKAVQQQLGVDQPDFGMLTDAMQINSGERLDWTKLQQPKAEAEIAFELATDLPLRRLNLQELQAAIAGARASIEIVGSRILNWDICINDTIADNASASHFVVSEKLVSLDKLDLVAIEMQLYKNGQQVSSGRGEACLGNPLNAALWLVNTWADLGIALKKGNIILAGALGPMVPASLGDYFRTEIDELGDVSVSF